MFITLNRPFRDGYEEKKGKGKEKAPQQSSGGGGAVASGPYVQRVMDDAREDEMEVSSVITGCFTSNDIKENYVILLLKIRNPFRKKIH